MTSNGCHFWDPFWKSINRKKGKWGENESKLGDSYAYILLIDNYFANPPGKLESYQLHNKRQHSTGRQIMKTKQQRGQ